MREMSRSQTGDLDIGVMRSTSPAFSNDFRFFPGTELSFGLGFLINEQDLPQGRRRGSLAWAGLSNTYFWIDPQSGICAVLMTQTMPFFDADVVNLLAEFEAAVYAGLDH